MIEAADPKFDIDETPRLLKSLGASRTGGGGQMRAIYRISVVRWSSALLSLVALFAVLPSRDAPA